MTTIERHCKAQSAAIAFHHRSDKQDSGGRLHLWVDAEQAKGVFRPGLVEHCELRSQRMLSNLKGKGELGLY